MENTTYLLHGLEFILTASLFFLAGRSVVSCIWNKSLPLVGLATCLSLWVIPIILLADSPRTMATQFAELVGRGAQYLQPTSRLLGLSMVALTALSYRHPDPDIATKWKDYAVCSCMLVVLAPYETLLIFPINDQVEEIGSRLRKTGKGLGDEYTQLKMLLRKWQMLQTGRILMPFLAALLSLWAFVGYGGV